jgi:hypothetical protein
MCINTFALCWRCALPIISLASFYTYLLLHLTLTLTISWSLIHWGWLNGWREFGSCSFCTVKVVPVHGCVLPLMRIIYSKIKRTLEASFYTDISKKVKIHKAEQYFQSIVLPIWLLYIVQIVIWDSLLDNPRFLFIPSLRNSLQH